MATTVTPPGTAAQPLNSPDHATWAGQVYNDLRSLDTAVAGSMPLITHPNIDDVLVRVWDAGKVRWQTVHYDSGWRDVTSMLLNGWTTYNGVSGFHLRRVGDLVYVRGTDLKASLATGDQMIALPVGFTAAHYHSGAYVRDGGYSPAYWRTAGASIASNDRVGTWSPFSIELDTLDPIPTSLPGSLYAPAPA